MSLRWRAAQDTRGLYSNREQLSSRTRLTG